MHIKRERDLLPLQLHELQLHAKRTRQEEHTAEQQQLQEDNADLPPSHALPWGCQVSVGGRAYQEDAHSVGSLDEDRHLWAVYDGHGGPDVSDFLARNMRQTVSNALALSESCEAALRQAFRESDASLPESSSSQGGSTALVVVVDNKHITCANAGDSRAVLARGGRAVALSCDHKPDNAEEALRIQEAGGTILNTSGVRRVMGVLSMTRAIGDSWLQQYGVTPEPEVRTFDRCDKDELMILASDGLWDVLCNQEAVDVARRCLQRACSKGASRRAASKIAAQVLVRMAADKGSRDNITVIVVDLALPSGSPAATPKPEPQLPAAAKCGEPAVAVVCQTTCSQAATARRHSEPSVACGKSTSGVDTPAWPLQLPRLLSAERLSLLITASSAPPLLILA